MLEVSAVAPFVAGGDGAGLAALPGEKKSYRPDIDGLRSVAVLSVVLYHLNKAWVPGGYVGVDIFFVISGFLITRNIWGEMVTGRFSLANFYLRRIRRIAPAFLVMTIVTVSTGAVLLLPNDLLSLAKSALWGGVSLSNVYFWRHLDTSYFAESSDQVPLLHTWSLGVEEQFYFIWPTLLLLALLVPKRRVGALAIAAIICVASFVCGELTNVIAQKFSYYMLPARAGELMIGALVALWGAARTKSLSTPLRRVWLTETLATFGVGFVAYSLYMLNDASKFPGVNAIFPCVGAALLMLAGEFDSRVVKALLTSRLVVFVGLISYSLYLWHWPVLAFTRYFYGTVESMRAVVAIIAMLVFSVLSYRYVELPTRHWRGRPIKQVFALYVAPSAALCLFAMAIVSTGGFKKQIESTQSYRDGVARVEKYTAPAYEFHYNCQLSAFDPSILRATRCIVGVSTGTGAVAEPGMLLWGDSEAAHYIGLIAQIAKRGDFNFRNATHSACPPVFGGDYSAAPYKAGCDKFRPYIESAVMSGAFRTILISGAWSNYDAIPGFRKDFEHTLDEITSKGVHVVIIGQAPYFSNYNRNCELRGLRIGRVDCGRRLAIPDTGETKINRFLASTALTRSGVTYLGVRDFICHNKICNPYIGGRPVYYDGSHLSMDGSWAIGEKLLSSEYYASWNAVINKNAAEPTVAGSVSHHINVKSWRMSRPQAMPRILGGYKPNFRYVVRSESNSNSLTGPAGIVLEFAGVSADRAVSSMERDFYAAGFKRVSRGSSGNTVRMDFVKPGFPKVWVSIGSLGGAKPLMSDAVGTVYIHW